MEIRCKHCQKLLAKILLEETGGFTGKIEWVCVRCKKYNNHVLGKVLVVIKITQ